MIATTKEVAPPASGRATETSTSNAVALLVKRGTASAALLPGGRLLQPLTNAVITCSNFLCLVAYMVIFADCVGTLLPWVARNVAILVGCVLVLPLLVLDQS